MSDPTHSWYVAAGGDRPLGPLTETQVRESLLSGNFSQTTLCWREGMSQWLAVKVPSPLSSGATAVRVGKIRPEEPLVDQIVELAIWLSATGSAGAFGGWQFPYRACACPAGKQRPITGQSFL